MQTLLLQHPTRVGVSKHILLKVIVEFQVACSRNVDDAVIILAYSSSHVARPRIVGKSDIRTGLSLEGYLAGEGSRQLGCIVIITYRRIE